MNVMITGAQFTNKGAQSLLFSLISQMREHYSDLNIYFLPLDDYQAYDADRYKFEVVYGKDQALAYAGGMVSRILITTKCVIKSLLKKEHIPLRDIKRYHEVLGKTDVLIDISGYQLSSKWKLHVNRRYLQYIENAKKHCAKAILMPQSFGPFAYGDAQAEMEDRITATLQNTDLIFAREQEGAQLLDNLGIKAQVSPDLVLQTDTIKWENIFYAEPELNYPVLETKNNVGIIPNFQTFEHGNKEKVLNIYQDVIRDLLLKRKNVYIFRHSEDLDACKEIYKRSAAEPHVHLIEDELDCLAYSKFISQFDYIVASRYHAVVHAYKEGIPVVILGWATKYQELARHMDQEQYVFDITGSDDAIGEKVISALERMERSVGEEKVRIAAGLDRMRRNSCFEYCWEVIG